MFFMTECLKTSQNFSLPLENTVKTQLTELVYLLDDRPPSTFSLYSSLYILQSQN